MIDNLSVFGQTRWVSMQAAGAASLGSSSNQRLGDVVARHDQRLLVTPEEAALRLSIGRTTLYHLLGTGALESVRVGRSRRIRVAALELFVEQLKDNRLPGDTGAP